MVRKHRYIQRSRLIKLVKSISARGYRSLELCRQATSRVQRKNEEKGSITCIGEKGGRREG